MSKLADHYRVLDLVDRMRRDGLVCPKCGCASSGHRVVEGEDSTQITCASCGVELSGADLAGEPVFEMDGPLVVLYRPVGPDELALIEASGWKQFPARRPEQPIFYPVLSRRYAEYIAKNWNVVESRAGFVTRFRVGAAVARNYPVQVVGAGWHQELWVPAAELDAFNRAIDGAIEVVNAYGPPGIPG